jgi:hypothetical protein
MQIIPSHSRTRAPSRGAWGHPRPEVGGERSEQPTTGRWSGNDSNSPFGPVTTRATVVAESAVPRAPENCAATQQTDGAPQGRVGAPLRGARNGATSHPPGEGPERTARGWAGGAPPRRRPPLRNGPGYPSGRPGNRWLRVSTKAVVYWASGPFPGHTCRSGGPPPPYPRGRRGPLASRATRRARWTWLPVAACTCGATPHGPAVVDATAECPRSDVLWWTWPNLLAPDQQLSTPL